MYVASRGNAQINILNKYLERLLRFLKQPKEPSAIIGVAVYTVFVMFLVAAVSAANMMWGVYVGDRLVAVVGNPAEANVIVNQLIDESRDAGEASTLFERVRLKQTWESGTFMAGTDLKLALSEAVMSKVKGVEVVVNGRAILAMNNLEDAENMLNALKTAYSTPGGSTDFAEEVILVETLVDKNNLVSVDMALQAVKSGSLKADTYEVSEGDTLWGIASSIGVQVEKLIASNPGMNPERLNVGGIINLDRTEPLINVQTIISVVSTELINSPVEERKDSSLYLGERKVIDRGKDGKREVTYAVTMRNGIEVERKAVQEIVLSQPQPKVIAMGSRVLLASRSAEGGRLARPTPGRVVSNYGMRDGRMHTGVDFGGGTGSPVVASESGTVIAAHWYGGYGKCVDISHGSGVVTRYSHLSSINVQVGQKVSRGEFIGRLGATGQATGPNLHFEVIVNGKQVNPMNFI